MEKFVITASNCAADLSSILSTTNGLNSKELAIKLKLLYFDTDLDGLKDFPTEFLSKLVSFNNDWSQYKSNFILLRKTIPPLKSLSFTGNKTMLSHQKFGDNYEFTIVN